MPTAILPAAERDVITCLHRLGQSKARELREWMTLYRPMTHGSLATLLNRLEARRLVVRDKFPHGKAFNCRPNRKHGVTFRGLLTEIVERVFHGDGLALAASLFETKPPTREEIGKLEQLLIELRKDTPAKGTKAS